MMRILIVEDQSLVALDLERTLRMAGHEIIGVAATADKAHELASAETPDLALVDIRLADGDTGPAVARALWERYLVPSLFVTGHGTNRPEYTEAALGLLQKPVSPKTLLRSVNVVRRIMRNEPLANEDVPPDLRLFVAL